MLEKLMNFLDKSYSTFHAVELIRSELLFKGYRELNEEYKFEQNIDKYFIVKNRTTVIAFKIGKEAHKDNFFNISATHTDFPQYKLKPNSIIEKEKYIQLNTEPYGGMIHTTWMDRPLGISGRVFIEKDNIVKEQLVNLENALVIPNLAIHLNREQNTTLNPQIHLLPILTNTEKVSLEGLLQVENIISHDLYLYNCESSKIVGADKKFLMSSKIDNLESTYLCFQSFLDSEAIGTNVFVCFDNEEVGSRSINGADSNVLLEVLNQINNYLNNQGFEKVMSNSFLVSCDNAHGFLPNYSQVFDATNRVHLNEGVVIKYNANKSYSTDGYSSSIFKMIAKKANVPVQQFTNRSDMRGGSTLGSILLSHLSVPMVDIGLAQFAMHSCYETCGVKDINYLYQVMKIFYNSKIIKINKEEYKIY